MKTLLIIGASTCACFAQANLLVNGSFEDTPVANNSFQNVVAGSSFITGWTVTGTSVDVIAGPTTWIPQNGNQSIDLAGTPGPGAVGQSFTTIIGQDYEVNFYLGSNHQGSGDKSVNVYINGVSENLTGGLTNGSWVQFTRTFTASALSTEVKFESTNSGNFGGAVDNVSVEAVPEPLTLVGLGLMGLAAVRRRRKS